MFRTTNNVLLALMLAAALLPTSGLGADLEPRKLKTKVEPDYPSLARQIHIAGTVKVEVVIAANGAIKSTRALGGHPLLVQSAEQALKKWRYEPGPETTTVIEFHFTSN